MTRTLKKRKILVTREKSQAEKFAGLIKKWDGVPIEVPLLTIRCSEDIEKGKNMSQFQWIFFTSAHGVDCFFNIFNNAEQLKHCQFATVGHKTERALKKYGFVATFIPSTYNAEVMAEEFFNRYPHANNILLVRGNLSRQLLVQELTERQLDFETLVVYDTAYDVEMKEPLLRALEAHHIDLLTFTSPSTVRAFMTLLGDHPFVTKALQIPSVCIGTTTEKAARDYQFEQRIVPDTFTIESMVESMIDFIEMEG